MFNLYPNSNFYPNPNPKLAMSDYYIQACRVLAGGCSGISTVSRVRVRVKVGVRDRCVKGQTWYHGMDVAYTHG